MLEGGRRGEISSVLPPGVPRPAFFAPDVSGIRFPYQESAFQCSQPERCAHEANFNDRSARCWRVGERAKPPGVLPPGVLSPGNVTISHHTWKKRIRFRFTRVPCSLLRNFPGGRYRSTSLIRNSPLVGGCEGERNLPESCHRESLRESCLLESRVPHSSPRAYQESGLRIRNLVSVSRIHSPYQEPGFRTRSPVSVSGIRFPVLNLHDRSA